MSSVVFVNLAERNFDAEERQGNKVKNFKLIKKPWHSDNMKRLAEEQHSVHYLEYKKLNRQNYDPDDSAEDNNRTTENVQQYMEAKNQPCKPDKSWWFLVYILLDFTDMVNITFQSLQGLTTLVSTQEFMLKELADNIRCEGCVTGPIMQIAPVVANEDTYVKGLYFATKADAEEHIQNKEIFVQDVMQKLKDSDVVAYAEILCCVCILHIDALWNKYITSGLTKESIEFQQGSIW